MDNLPGKYIAAAQQFIATHDLGKYNRAALAKGGKR
jgi:hypothetical protein